MQVQWTPLTRSADATLAKARASGDKAAAELGVRLSLPLALCLLPAFVLIGVVPLLIAVGGAVVGDVSGVRREGGPNGQREHDAFAREVTPHRGANSHTRRDPL